MFNRIVSVVFLVFIALTSIPLFLTALLLRLATYPFDRRLRLLHLFTCFWASLYTWTMPAWRIYIEGREKIRKNATYMVVSNHQSQLDILVAFRLFFHYKWVSKIEIFRVPLIGWNMRLNRYVQLKRGDKQSIEKMLRDCAVHLEEVPFSCFRRHTVARRRGQAFKPALQRAKNVPILPIVISGDQ